MPLNLTVLFHQSMIQRIQPAVMVPGIAVYKTSLLRSGSGICLPGIGIFIHRQVEGADFQRMLQHEYGHYLDYKYGVGGDRKTLLGSAFLGFYLVIGLSSLLNLIPGVRSIPVFRGDHRTFWTETRANALAKDFFGTSLAKDFERLYPLNSHLDFGDKQT